jgi:hypothetical protein
LIAVTPLHAQGKKEKPAATSRTILKSMQLEVPTEGLTDPMKFGKFLELTREILRAFNAEVTFQVDDEAYREVSSPDTPNVFDTEIRLRNLPAKANATLLLRQALKQLPTKSAFVVRAGRVEIVPFVRTAKEYMLNQTFHVDFSERRLDQTLEELSELTGVSIVLDGRTKQKAQTPVTARFHDDVALQDAVRMLTDMAELKIVYLVTGIYVTTPEHAAVMQKELLKAYGYPDPGAAPAGVGPFGPLMGPGPNLPSDTSPLMPPLPPRMKQMEGAA